MHAEALRWVYALALLPLATELIETGQLPVWPRGWVTEIVSGVVIAVLAHRLRRQHLAVLAMARFDALTSLLNRRVFDEAIEEEVARSQRSGQPLTLAVIDLDNFKLLNDRSGHAAGDVALRQLAAAIRDSVRARVDRGFRLGGDELALLFPGGTPEQAGAVLARIREHCGRADPVWIGGPLAISAGVVELRQAESAAAFVERADGAMYVDKRRHR